ncbi:amidase, partial [Enterococcus faecalis]|nr:amidase [Enterococcus faecalis]
LHAEDQSVTEATDASVLELPEETVPSSTESMEVPMSSEEGTVPSTVPSEEVPATSSEDSQETVSSAPVESETTHASS